MQPRSSETPPCGPRWGNPTPEDWAFSKLLSYAAYQFPRYHIGHHHRRIAEALEKIESREIDRLIITMPPRHGKSFLASEFFPAWYLGRNPEHYVIASSYAQDLADDFGRRVRNQLLDPAYQGIFPGVTARKDSTSVRRFHTAQGGTYYAAGVGGPITGRGAHLLLIDDPVKNREDADSEIIRKKTYDWYTSTAYTRLMPGAAIVAIQTRWNEDDLAGHLLLQKEEGWVHLDLPAINAAGEALWPEQYPLERLEAIRRTLPPRDWSALYQQRPAPEDGDYFKREWFQWYDEPPKHLKTYIASDYAVTEGGGDFTVHIAGGVDPNDDLYLLDIWRGREASLTWVEWLLDMVLKWKPLEMLGETGQIERAVGPLIVKRMVERKIYCHRKTYTIPRGGADKSGKEIAAQSIRGRCAQKKVFLPKGKPWVADFLHELLVFPAGKYDDQVDAFGLFGRRLVEMVAATEPKDVQDPIAKLMKPKSFNDLLAISKKQRMRSEDD